MAIKIDSDELSREVLTQLEHLPEVDDVPDLISVDDDEPEERLKAVADQLMGHELLSYLDAMCDHADKKMREAAKAMVRKEFAGHTIRMWPALQKVLDDSP